MPGITSYTLINALSIDSTGRSIFSTFKITAQLKLHTLSLFLGVYVLHDDNIALNLHPRSTLVRKQEVVNP